MLMSYCGGTIENVLVEGGSRIFLPVLQNSQSVMRSVKNPMYSSALQRKGIPFFDSNDLVEEKKVTYRSFLLAVAGFCFTPTLFHNS